MSTTNLEVVVLDVNDNPPEFSSKAYFASVEEGAAGGAEGGSSEDVVRVLATSRDSGVNAEISYSIVGGNEHRLFSIDPKRGVVAVKGGGVDYERQVSTSKLKQKPCRLVQCVVAAADRLLQSHQSVHGCSLLSPFKSLHCDLYLTCAE